MALQSCLCTFDVEVKDAEEGTRVAIVGSHEFLGEWDLGRAVPMIQRQSNIFSASMHLPKNTDIEYKYVVERQGGKDTKERVFKPAGHLTVQRDTLALNADKPAPAGTCAVPPLSVHRKLSQVLATEWLSLTSTKVLALLLRKDKY